MPGKVCKALCGVKLMKSIYSSKKPEMFYLDIYSSPFCLPLLFSIQGYVLKCFACFIPFMNIIQLIKPCPI